jgi:hypothetical protein
MYCISGWGFCSSLPSLSIPHASFHSATHLHLRATIAPQKDCFFKSSAQDISAPDIFSAFRLLRVLSYALPDVPVCGSAAAAFSVMTFVGGKLWSSKPSPGKISFSAHWIRFTECWINSICFACSVYGT